MGLFTQVIELVENTVASVNLSGFDLAPSINDVLVSWVAPSIGVYRLDWHVYSGGPPGVVGVTHNDFVVFAPATVVIPDGGYSIQVSAKANDVLAVKILLTPPSPIYTDLIITQIG